MAEAGHPSRRGARARGKVDTVAVRRAGAQRVRTGTAPGAAGSRAGPPPHQDLPSSAVAYPLLPGRGGFHRPGGTAGALVAPAPLSLEGA